MIQSYYESLWGCLTPLEVLPKLSVGFWILSSINLRTSGLARSKGVMPLLFIGFFSSTCLQYFRDSEGKVFKNRPLGIKDVVFCNWRALKDCFTPGYRSKSLIGNENDPVIIQRNKKSLYTILNDLKINKDRCPALELSSRNSAELSSYILKTSRQTVSWMTWTTRAHQT